MARHRRPVADGSCPSTSGAKRVRPQNGTLDIVCHDENITRIFEITGLDRIFGIYPTREKALESATG